jgi:hypothetical protein
MDLKVAYAVERSYCNVSASRVMPGRKDCVSVQTDGTQGCTQERLVLCSLSEVCMQNVRGRSWPEDWVLKIIFISVT